ncbi:MAG: hypothetical protein Q8O75_00695 [bacterium]|nr:hypothetical protein [bacterium]
MPEDPQISADQPQSSRKINWKKILIVVAIAILLIGGGVAVWLLVGQPSTTPPSKTPTSTPSAETSTPSAQVDETANWKTYTSEIGGQIQRSGENITLKISYQHPKDFKLIQIEGVDILTNDQNYTGALMTPGSIEIFTSVGGSGSFNEGTTILLGDKSAKRLSKTTQKTGSYERTTVTYSVENADDKGNNFILYCAYLPKQNLNPEKTCDRIAATFRFD